METNALDAVELPFQDSVADTFRGLNEPNPLNDSDADAVTPIDPDGRGATDADALSCKEEVYNNVLDAAELPFPDSVADIFVDPNDPSPLKVGDADAVNPNDPDGRGTTLTDALSCEEEAWIVILNGRS